VQRTKEFEHAFQSTEELFRSILDTIPQLVWRSRPDGYVDYCNAQWLQYTGLSEEDIRGEAWSVVLHPDDKGPTLSVWLAAIRSGEPYVMHERMRRHDGEYRWFLVRANPLRASNGEILNWYGTCTDIHDQKIAENELRIEARRKDDFIALLAHELRNPLSPIRTAAKVLDKLHITDGPMVKKSLDIIERQIGTMSRLLDDLLDISRINRGVIELQIETVLLVDVIRSAIATTSATIEQFQQELELHIPEGDLVVRGDSVRLEQVFVNLLNNSAKYSNGPGRIVVTIEPAGDYISVKIRDTGIGIPEDLLPHIFDAFVQGRPSIERKAGGLGIGLNLTRSLVNLHHGEICARSEGKGKGAEFEVRLPMAPSA
jgi:PAS domain S-box-containing protein